MKQHKYTVVYTPDEGGWNAEIPEVQGCLTWGRSLDAARRYIRDALSSCVDIFGSEEEADRVAAEAELVDDVRLPGPAKRAVKEYEREVRKASDAAKRSQEAARKAALALTRETGISLRDAGKILGVSHVAVKDLASKGKGRGRAA